MKQNFRCKYEFLFKIFKILVRAPNQIQIQFPFYFFQNLCTRGNLKADNKKFVTLPFRPKPHKKQEEEKAKIKKIVIKNLNLSN